MFRDCVGLCMDLGLVASVEDRTGWVLGLNEGLWGLPSRCMHKQLKKGSTNT